MAARPELVAPPEIFYNAEEARKYTSNSHMIETQARVLRTLRRRSTSSCVLTPLTGTLVRRGSQSARWSCLLCVMTAPR